MSARKGWQWRAGVTVVADAGMISAANQRAIEARWLSFVPGARIYGRRGKLKALVAIARSILEIVWHLLAGRTARYRDLGASYHASRIDKKPQDARLTG